MANEVRLSGLEQALLRVIFFLSHDLRSQIMRFSSLWDFCSIPYAWQSRNLGQILELKRLWGVNLRFFGGHQARVYFLANTEDGTHIRHDHFHLAYISFWLVKREPTLPPPSREFETTIPEEILEYLLTLGGKPQHRLYGATIARLSDRRSMTDEAEEVKRLIEERFRTVPCP